MAIGKERHPWDGEVACAGTNNNGLPCSNAEIDGLDYCFWHVPDELLEEAEEITGWKRCRQGNGCRFVAVAGTEPPACKNHGANQGSNTYKGAASRVVENRVADRLAQILSEKGEALLNPPAIGNPLDALLEAAAEVKAFKEILRVMVASMDIAKWRYSNSKVGEMVRAEIILYERSLERLVSALERIARLKIEDRLAAVNEKQLQMMERALNLALQASGADLEGQDQARKVLRRELKVVA